MKIIYAITLLALMGVCSIYTVFSESENKVRKIIYAISLFFALIGVCLTYALFSQAKSYIQQTEALAIGIFFVIVPYVICRCIENILKK